MNALHADAASGMVFIHAAPKALCPHIEWAIGRALGDPAAVRWEDQPVLPGARRAEVPWQGREGSGAAIASALRGWPDVRFEVTEEGGVEGSRWMHTPSLGMTRTTVDALGTVLVSEHRVRAAIELAGRDVEALQRELRTALGTDWDDELEAFRHASDASPVIWLHKAG